jgi:hypothetical protein
LREKRDRAPAFSKTATGVAGSAAVAVLAIAPLVRSADNPRGSS